MKLVGESYFSIFRYMAPEVVTAFVLYSVPCLIDAFFIATLKSTTCYATACASNPLFHFIIKIAEGFSVSAIIVCGAHNGAGEYTAAGKSFAHACWIIGFFGAVVSGILYWGAPAIYGAYSIPEMLLPQCIEFMQLRAVGVFFAFLTFALFGFMRGIKNTRVPMYIFILGATSFVACDYILIWGKFGLSPMGLRGSAIAWAIQYAIMAGAGFLWIICSSGNRKYAVTLYRSVPTMRETLTFITLSVPVMIDKATIALAYIWLGKLINGMGTEAIASYGVMRDMERLSFLPAVAGAQVITLLASNSLGRHDWAAVRKNIRRTLLLSFVGTGVLLIAMGMGGYQIFINLFDTQKTFGQYALQVYPYIAWLLLLDVIQLVYSGALRGVAAVSTVMWTRIFVCGLYFVPVSAALAHYTGWSSVTKLTMLYGSFYIAHGIMSLIYFVIIRGKQWHNAVPKT